MRHVTVCENLGPSLVPGADHKVKYDRYRMAVGTCWDLNDETKDHHVIEITKKIAEAAQYTWELRWIDGRSVAVFAVGDAALAQPVTDDPRAKERRLGPPRKARAPRREAPGVAPEAAGAMLVDEPSRRRGKRPTEAIEAPTTRKRRCGPRGGLRIEL